MSSVMHNVCFKSHPDVILFTWKIYVDSMRPFPSEQVTVSVFLGIPWVKLIFHYSIIEL